MLASEVRLFHLSSSWLPGAPVSLGLLVASSRLWRSIWLPSIMGAFGGAPPSLTLRRASRVCMLLLLPLLLCHFAVTGVGAYAVTVGGSGQTWSLPGPGFSYQVWSNQISWCSCDTLSFFYDYTQHNVVQFPDKASFDSCDGSLGVGYSSLVTLPPVPPGIWYSTVYFGSTRDLDCESGMKFSVLFYTCATCVAPGSYSPGSSDPEEKNKSKFPIVAVIVPIVLVLVVAIVVLYCVRGARRRAQLAAGIGVFLAVPPSPPPTISPITVPNGFPPPKPSAAAAAAAAAAYGYGEHTAPNPPPRTMPVEGTRIFTYQELRTATHDFSEEIGKGGFGVVHKGVLGDGTVVAIKGVRLVDDAQHRDQLLNEAAILSKLNHRNLVRLLGWCVDAEVPLMLVYEFVPNGTLQEHLARSRQGFPTKLDWSTRFKIALQTAEALKYLHVQVTPQPIYHRDVKSANILLDQGFNAKVADFGLSKQLEVGETNATHVSTMVKGTKGYLDPEYNMKGQMTDKSDVYSLGVVLLELLVARKPLDASLPPREQSLAATAVPLIVSGKVLEILDPQLSTQLTSRETLGAIDGVAQVAVACLVHESASRPSMAQVLEMLQNIKSSDLRADQFYGHGLRAQCTTSSWSSDSGSGSAQGDSLYNPTPRNSSKLGAESQFYGKGKKSF